MHGGESQRSNRLVVAGESRDDERRALQRYYTLIPIAFVLAALAFTGCGGSMDSEATGPPATTTEATTTTGETNMEETTTAEEQSGESAKERVVMRMIKYQPETITIPVNTTVRWTNAESADHTVTSSDGTKLQSKILGKGGTYEATFTKPGTYRYFCEVHPFMKGVVIVEDA